VLPPKPNPDEVPPDPKPDPEPNPKPFGETKPVLPPSPSSLASLRSLLPTIRLLAELDPPLKLEDPKSNPESLVMGSSRSTSCLLSPTGFEDENGVEVPNRFDLDSSLILSSAPIGSTVKSSGSFDGFGFLLSDAGFLLLTLMELLRAYFLLVSLEGLGVGVEACELSRPGLKVEVLKGEVDTSFSDDFLSDSGLGLRPGLK